MPGDAVLRRPVNSSPAPVAPAKPGFWQHRVRAPLIGLLTQGTTPEKLASGIAWACVCSLFPILGCTTGLNAAVAAWRGLNQALMQTINYALGPLHLLMIVVYVRLGEWLWRADDERFSVADLVQSFRELSLGDFLQKFGWAGVHACTAWTLSAPLLFGIAYFIARPSLRRLAHLLPASPRPD